MLRLSAKWGKYLRVQPESGMGYWIVTVILNDGRRYERAIVIDSGHLTQIDGYKDVPFTEDQIVEMKVTHDKWDFA
jgi:hypothetical protein